MCFENKDCLLTLRSAHFASISSCFLVLLLVHEGYRLVKRRFKRFKIGQVQQVRVKFEVFMDLLVFTDGL